MKFNFQTPLLLQGIPEKLPATLTLVFVAGLTLLSVWLLLSFVRRRRSRSALAAVAGGDLERDVRGRLGTVSTNRGLQVLRVVFFLLAIGVFSAHVYWARYAEDRNERFQELSYKDLRNRRLAESTLRGWIYDRTGELDKAFALYRRDERGRIVRDYPLPEATAHLLGSERGDAGLERALFGMESSQVPETLDVVRERNVRQPANLDVRLTIHGELQKHAVDQLKGRAGAIVALNPQTGEVLALYSNPSYNLDAAQDEATYIRLDADKRNSPLVNRALASYYIPGSTFKTVTMIAGYLAGQQDAEFVCSGGGFYAERGGRPVFDAGGTGEVHGRIGVAKAYEVSCNQYFAQLAIKVGPEGMRRAAEQLAIGVANSRENALRGRKLPQLWNVSDVSVARALAPRESTIVSYERMRPYDLGLVGFGQGYSGQMTPFQMALVASAIGNLEGKLMRPKIEFDQPPAAYSQVITPQQARELREIMHLVPGGASGTARGVFADLEAAGFRTGGKTGTAEKQIPLYDPRTGEPRTERKYERDRRGNIIREYEAIVLNPDLRVDSWYLSIAPLDNPQIALAVIVEGGGYGSKVAAPIAKEMILKASQLKLLGDVPAVGAPAQPQQARPARAARR